MAKLKNLDGLVVYDTKYDELGIVEYSESFSNQFNTTLFVVKKEIDTPHLELYSSYQYLLAANYVIIGEL